jgi:hypothetical protein
MQQPLAVRSQRRCRDVRVCLFGRVSGTVSHLVGGEAHVVRRVQVQVLLLPPGMGWRVALGIWKAHSVRSGTCLRDLRVRLAPSPPNVGVLGQLVALPGRNPGAPRSIEGSNPSTPTKTQETGVRVPLEQATACSVAQIGRALRRPGMRVRAPLETARPSSNWLRPGHNFVSTWNAAVA